MDTTNTTSLESTETFRIIDGRTIEEEQNITSIQHGTEAAHESSNEHIFNSFTPLSFDSLTPKINLTIHHLHLQFNNLPDTPPFQSLLPWSDSICHRLLLTEREFNFYSAESNKTLLIPHKLISLHGITTVSTSHRIEANSSNGTASMVKSAIYCQLDLNLTETCQSSDHIEDAQIAETGEEEDPSTSPLNPDPIELIITPTELSIGENLSLEEMNEKLKKIVQHLYDSISTCISLNPLPIISNGSGEGDIKGGSYEIDDSLISAFLDNTDDDILLDQNSHQSVNQIDPSHRFQPY